jgi:restriction system protein
MKFDDEYKILAPKLEQSIEQGYFVNTLHNGKVALLHGAAKFDDIDTARLLIDNQADIEIKDRRGETPLHYAAACDSQLVVNQLIKTGANVNATNKYGVTPTHLAGSGLASHALHQLIKNGANVNARDAKNNTPLHYAIGKSYFARARNSAGIVPVINELLKHGANVNAVGEDGMTPLHYAAKLGIDNAIDILIRAGADKNISDTYDLKPEDSVLAVSTTYLSETLKNAITNVVRANLQTLSRKRKQLIQNDDYGVHDTTKWNKELDYFVINVLAPRLDMSDTYIRWVVTSINESGDYDGSPRSDFVRYVESAFEKVLEEEVINTDGISSIEDMSPVEYETMCADILTANGWIARITNSSGDQGVDVFAEKDGCSVVIQCKKYSSPVGNKAVQEAHAGKGYMDASEAVVVTNSSYTASAKQLATSLGVLLLHHDELGYLSNKLQSLNKQ